MPSRFDDALDHLILTIEHPWESIDQSLRENKVGDDPGCLGDPMEEGTGAWHLWHTLEVFRYHAGCVVGEAELGRWPAVPPREAPPEAVRDALLADAKRFSAWCRSNAVQLSTKIIAHGEGKPFTDMLAMMTRHIVWHAAAVHYWARWKGPREG